MTLLLNQCLAVSIGESDYIQNKLLKNYLAGGPVRPILKK